MTINAKKYKSSVVDISLEGLAEFKIEGCTMYGGWRLATLKALAIVEPGKRR